MVDSTNDSKEQWRQKRSDSLVVLLIDGWMVVLFVASLWSKRQRSWTVWCSLTCSKLKGRKFMSDFLCVSFSFCSWAAATSQIACKNITSKRGVMSGVTSCEKRTVLISSWLFIQQEKTKEEAKWENSTTSWEWPKGTHSLERLLTRTDKRQLLPSLKSIDIAERFPDIPVWKSRNSIDKHCVLCVLTKAVEGIRWQSFRLQYEHGVNNDCLVDTECVKKLCQSCLVVNVSCETEIARESVQWEALDEKKAGLLCVWTKIGHDISRKFASGGLREKRREGEVVKTWPEDKGLFSFFLLQESVRDLRREDDQETRRSC